MTRLLSFPVPGKGEVTYPEGTMCVWESERHDDGSFTAQVDVWEVVGMTVAKRTYIQTGIKAGDAWFEIPLNSA